MSGEKKLFYKMVAWQKRLEREIPFFKEILEGSEKKHPLILDVGCGAGHHLIELAYNNFKGVGVDISPESIEIAKKQAKHKNCDDKLDFIVADMRDFQEQLGTKKFDLILCLGNSLSLFSNEERKVILEQIIDCLDNNGIAIIQAVNYFKHFEDTEWLINPRLKREEQKLNFYVRIMEWENEKKERVRMYVETLSEIGNNESSGKFFEHQEKVTYFYALTKEDFETLKNLDWSLQFYGDFQKSEFNSEKSNDIIIRIKKE